MSDSCVCLELFFFFATNDSFGNQMYLRILLLLGFASESVLVFFFHFGPQPSRSLRVDGIKVESRGRSLHPGEHAYFKEAPLLSMNSRPSMCQ